jgi:hypothetical protein
LAKAEPFSVRISQDSFERIWSVIEATGGEITRSEIIDRAVKLFLNVLESEPAMIPGYNPDAKVSVRQNGKK